MPCHAMRSHPIPSHPSHPIRPMRSISFVKAAATSPSCAHWLAPHHGPHLKTAREIELYLCTCYSPPWTLAKSVATIDTIF